MSDALRRSQFAGMNDRGILLSRLRFSGVVKVWDVQKRKKISIDGDVPYWIVKDQYGASFLVWEELLIKGLRVGENYAFTGDIKVGKGSVFMVLKKAKIIDTRDFTDV